MQLTTKPSQMTKLARRSPGMNRKMPDRSPLIRVTAMPTDLNPYGGVFGGWLMAQMALGAGSLASREGQGKAVVVI